MIEKKFKVWDKEKKEWINDFKILPNGQVEVGERVGAEWRYAIKDVEVIQFTGFLDKLEKAIYEGDICNDGSVVVFVGGRFLLMYKDGKFEDLIGDGEEIIGNIYENEDLAT